MKITESKAGSCFSLVLTPLRPFLQMKERRPPPGPRPKGAKTEACPTLCANFNKMRASPHLVRHRCRLPRRHFKHRCRQRCRPPARPLAQRVVTCKAARSLTCTGGYAECSVCLQHTTAIISRSSSTLSKKGAATSSLTLVVSLFGCELPRARTSYHDQRKNMCCA